MKQTRSGFTIVELLIVIVVIAILATISIVAYTGIQNRAAQTAIVSEVNQWKRLFEAYKAVHGRYPAPAAGDPLTSGGPGTSSPSTYCLGTGFPQVSGVSYCHVVSSTSEWRVEESTGAYLLSQLSTVGTPPVNSKKYVYGGNTVGPVLVYNSITSVQIYTIFPGGTDCMSLGMQAGYGTSNRQDCFYRLNYST